MLSASRLAEKLDLLSNLDVGLEKLLEIATVQKQNDVQNWLDALENEDRYNDNLSLHLHGTCSWVIGNSAYAAWEFEGGPEEVAKLLWIHGPAGFGKTVLSAWLIRHLKDSLKFLVASCFASLYSQKADQLDGVVRAWIMQLAQENDEIFSLVQAMRHKHKTRRASKDDLWVLLRSILTQIQSCILVLDGLDEFQNANDNRRSFLCKLKAVISSTKARVLITSRNEIDIESELSPTTSAPRPQDCVLLECRISKDDVRDDVDLFSQSVVARKLPKQDELFRQQLAAEIAERCDGMFLWIRLQQDRLRSGKSKKDLHKIVQAMPQGLQDTYRRSWDSIQNLVEEERDRAINILRWLTFAYRPLTVMEMAEALIINTDEEQEAICEDDLPEEIDSEYIDGEIKGLCGSLIEVRDGDEDTLPKLKTVHLIHASVKEFLVKALPIPMIVEASSSEPEISAVQHVKLAADCLRSMRHLGSCVFSDGEDGLSFPAYAADFWHMHLQDADNYLNSISGLVNTFINPGSKDFGIWKEWLTKINREDDCSATPMYYASLLGLLPSMDFLYNNEKSDINCVGGRYGTPLQAVCVTGHSEAFRRLLDWNADVTIRGGQFDDALNAAAFHGRTDMVKLLLKGGAHMDSSNHTKQAPLMMAASGGSVDVVRLLLDAGIEVNPEELVDPTPRLSWVQKGVSTPLHQAAMFGHLETIELLLKQGAKTNVQNYREDTPLHVAASTGHPSVITILIDHAAEIDAFGMDSWTPLHHAASNGHSATVAELLKRGANIDPRTKEGRTPLSYAAEWGYLSVANLLLQEGADANSTTNTGWTLVHSAVEGNHLEIVKLLLQNGAIIKADNLGWTPLHVAAEEGFFELAVLFLEHGTDINAQSHSKIAPLHSSISHGQFAIAHLLLNNGAIIKADSYGRTPLHVAAEQASLEPIAWLLEHGANINALDDHNRTPLHFATMSSDDVSEHQRLAVAQLLLTHGATFRADDDGWTPLHLAAEYGYKNIVALYLDNGCPIDAPNKVGLTPLCIAADQGQFDTAELILSRGADVNISEENSKTPLYIVASRGHTELVRSLVKNGSCINTKTDLGFSPLSEAIQKGTAEMVEFLIQRGADLSIIDCFGMRCSDWLQLLRPQLNISVHKEKELKDISHGPEISILRHTILDITMTLKNNNARGVSHCYSLAHGFLMLDREEDAKLAILRRILAERQDPGVLSGCDGCNTELSKEDCIFLCKTCPDFGLCGGCMTRHEEKCLSEVCCDHQFMKIVTTDQELQLVQTESFDQWLARITEQFRDA